MNNTFAVICFLRFMSLFLVKNWIDLFEITHREQAFYLLDFIIILVEDYAATHERAFIT